MKVNSIHFRSWLAALLIVALSLPASSLAADKRAITEADLFKFVWIADAQISPDGSRVAFVRVWVNQKADRYDSALWIVPTNSGPSEKPRQLTQSRVGGYGRIDLRRRHADGATQIAHPALTVDDGEA